jgi:hypothetical protein
MYRLAFAFVLACAAPVYSQYSYQTFNVPDSPWTDIDGINDRGNIVGSYIAQGVTHGFVLSGDDDHGFLLSGDQYTIFDFPGDDMDTVAYGIDDSGDIVGSYYGRQIGQHGFILSEGVYTTIDPPDSHRTLALGINNSGVIAGMFFVGPNVRGFIATPKP